MESHNCTGMDEYKIKNKESLKKKLEGALYSKAEKFNIE